MSHLKPQQIMIELCCLSYLEDTSQSAQVISDAIKAGMSSHRYHLRDWSITWGPVLSADAIFMMYVAGNPSANEYAVVIRGTDPSSVQAWAYDFDLLPVAPPYGTGVSIAKGVRDEIDALNVLTPQSLQPPQPSQTLVQYLTGLAGSPTIYLTGHSFGATIAVAYAPWLVAQGVSSPQVITFAGPSAGDQAFASYFNQLFPSAENYVNTLDIVPKFWASLSEIAATYPPPGPACPEWIAKLLEAVGGLSADYAQTSQVPKTGTLQGSESWYDEVEAQHDHFTYAKLFHLHLQPHLHHELEIQALLASGRLGTALTKTAGSSH